MNAIHMLVVGPDGDRINLFTRTGAVPGVVSLARGINRVPTLGGNIVWKDLDAVAVYLGNGEILAELIEYCKRWTMQGAVNTASCNAAGCHLGGLNPMMP